MACFAPSTVKRRNRAVRLKAWGAALALGLAAASCHTQVATADVVAKVDGVAITKADFEQQVARALKRYGEQRQKLPDGTLSRLQDGVLRNMVDASIVGRRAEQEGIEVAGDDLERALAAHRARFRSREAYDDYLARADHSEAALREELRKSLLCDRLVEKLAGNVTVSDAQVLHFYNENPDHFVQPEQLRAHRLYLAFVNDASAAQRQKVRKRAEQLRAQAHKTRHDAGAFVAMCRRHGDGPEAEHDGDLGLMPAGRVPELDRAISEGLQAGELSDVVDSGRGVAIFRLDAHAPKQRRPLAEVAPSIRTNLLLHMGNERRQQVLQDLRAAANVQILVNFERRMPAAPATLAPPVAPQAAPVKTPAPAVPAAAPGRQEVGQGPGRFDDTRAFG